MSKYEIGDRVDSGVVTGMVDGNKYLMASASKYNMKTHPWSAQFPEWWNEPVYDVTFDEPQRSMTLREWIDMQNKRGMSELMKKHGYENLLSEELSFSLLLAYHIDVPQYNRMMIPKQGMAKHDNCENL